MNWFLSFGSGFVLKNFFKESSHLELPQMVLGKCLLTHKNSISLYKLLKSSCAGFVHNFSCLLKKWLHSKRAIYLLNRKFFVCKLCEEIKYNISFHFLWLLSLYMHLVFYCSLFCLRSCGGHFLWSKLSHQKLLEKK